MEMRGRLSEEGGITKVLDTSFDKYFEKTAYISAEVASRHYLRGDVLPILAVNKN